MAQLFILSSARLAFSPPPSLAPFFLIIIITIYISNFSLSRSSYLSVFPAPFSSGGLPSSPSTLFSFQRALWWPSLANFWLAHTSRPRPLGGSLRRTRDLLPGELKLRRFLGAQPLRLPALTLLAFSYPTSMRLEPAAGEVHASVHTADFSLGKLVQTEGLALSRGHGIFRVRRDL